MAIAVATLANTPYEIGSANPPKVYNVPPIFAYDWNTARVTTATGPSNPLSYLDHPCNQDNRYFPITSRANMRNDSNRSGAGK